MKPLLVIIPSKGRPNGLMACVNVLQTNSDGLGEIMLVLHTDSPPLPDKLPDIVKIVTHDERPMLRALDAAIMEQCDKYEIIGFLGDDVRIWIKHWDTKIYNYLHGKAGIWYGRDEIQNRKLPTHPFFSSIIPRAIGVGVPPGLKHFYFDNYNKELGKRLGCLKYNPWMQIEHLHHSVRKSLFDQTYADAEKHEPGDKAAFAEFMKNDLDSYSEKVRAAVARTPLKWLK